MSHWPNKETIQGGVIKMLRVNMGLAAGERLLVLTDLPRPEDWQTKPVFTLEEMLERVVLARLVADIAAENFPESQVFLHPFPATGGNGTEPDEAVVARMMSADVVLALTTYSMSHTNARTRACEKGARVASMPQFEARMFEPGGPLAVNSQQVSQDVQRFAARLTKARQVTVRTPDGTELEFSLEGRPGQVDDGILSGAPGKWGNLPAGEAYAVPVEGSGQGKLVVPAGWYPHLDEKMIFEVKDGLVIALQGGGAIGDKFRQLLNLKSDEPIYRARRNLAELGIGCNPNARKPDNVLEAEKIKGTLHIAFGDNLHMGGQVESDFHEDFVQPQVDLILDGEVVIAKGEWKI